MKHTLVQSRVFYKMVFFIILGCSGMLCVSYSIKNDTHLEPNGTYILKASGAYSGEIKGDVDFETYWETSVDGALFSILKLNFKNSKTLNHNTCEFIISQPGKNRDIAVGSYNVSKKIKGFLHCFKGAFGYANINTFGEIPFFAQKGTIALHQVLPDMVKGTVSVYLKNAEGKTIFVTGNFTAPKRKRDK